MGRHSQLSCGRRWTFLLLRTVLSRRRTVRNSVGRNIVIDQSHMARTEVANTAGLKAGTGKKGASWVARWTSPFKTLGEFAQLTKANWKSLVADVDDGCSRPACNSPCGHPG